MVEGSVVANLPHSSVQPVIFPEAMAIRAGIKKQDGLIFCCRSVVMIFGPVRLASIRI